MIVRLAPSPDQIRWYAQDALGSFETLSPDDAVENAKHGLRAILQYLDAFEGAPDVIARQQGDLLLKELLRDERVCVALSAKD